MIINDHDANERRLIANQIMHDLWQYGSVSQLELLRQYAESAINDIKAKEQKK